MSSGPEFYRVCCTKAQYDEEGPRIARYSTETATGLTFMLQIKVGT